MHYIKVAWEHGYADEPVALYSACDDEGWEVRKVEVFRDGRFGYASRAGSAEGSILGIEPIPSLAEIAQQTEFRPAEIPQEEFERVWSAAQADQLVAAAKHPKDD